MVWWMRRVWTVWKEGNSENARLPWLTMLSGAVAFLIFLAPESVGAAWQLDRGSSVFALCWQSITSHLTHWNFEHLVWDLAVFIVVGSMVERRSRNVWLGLFLASAVAISISFLIWVPDLQFYRGLSGIDMAFVGYWIGFQLKGSPRKLRGMWGMGLLLVVAKPLAEILFGQALFVSDLGPGNRNVPLAHLVGAGVGALFAFCAAGVGARPGVRLFSRDTRHSASAGPTVSG